MSALKDAMDAMLLPDGEPFLGETVREDGWVYRDFPRMTRERMSDLLVVVGDGNIKWLSFADYGDAVRGQCFISPAGIAAIRAHLLARTAPGEE